MNGTGLSQIDGTPQKLRRPTVIESHEDGSLTMQRPGSRGRRARVTLPADYVADHVELG
ncbi:MAG TPA: hypothetical protein VFW38_12095 [Solirubrobacteraceae bacterium]|nr:hypothetical protein [Solirubrobacteraceae bacterium]